MEGNEMEPGPGDECSQALQEFQRAHHEMGSAIAVRGFELEDDLAGWGTAQSFVAQGRTAIDRQNQDDLITTWEIWPGVLFRSFKFEKKKTHTCRRGEE